MGTPPGCPRLFSPCHGATLVSFLSLSAALLSSPKFASSHSLATKFVGRQIRSLIANRLPLSKKEEHIYSSSALEVKTIFIPSFRNIVKKKGNSPISRLARVEPAPQVQGRDFFCAAEAGPDRRHHSPGPRRGAVARTDYESHDALRRRRQQTWHRAATVRSRKPGGGGVEVMAARAAGSGGWEVVKRGRRPGPSSGGRGGGGDRRTLGEANGVLKYDLSCEYPPPPTWACGAGARRTAAGAGSRSAGTGPR